MVTFINSHGCSVKENENGIWNGMGKVFIPVYATLTTTKSKKGVKFLEEMRIQRRRKWQDQ